MKQTVPILHAKSCDQYIDGFTDGDAPGAKRTVMANTRQGDIATNHRLENKRIQRLTRLSSIPVVAKALQDFHEDEVTDHDGLYAEDAIEQRGFAGRNTVEIVDPDGRIDD